MTYGVSTIAYPTYFGGKLRRYGVFGHDLDGVRAVGLVDAYRPGCADAVAVREDHDFPHCLLLGPGGENAGSANRADAIDPAQSVRRRLDDVEYPLTEGPQELLG